jgi:hypothetical protein
MTSKTLPLRLDEELIARLDRLAATMTERAGGAEISRAAALRAALSRGLDALEAELGAADRRPKPKPQRK